MRPEVISSNPNNIKENPVLFYDRTTNHVEYVYMVCDSFASNRRNILLLLFHMRTANVCSVLLAHRKLHNHTVRMLSLFVHTFFFSFFFLSQFSQFYIFWLQVGAKLKYPTFYRTS